MTLAPQTAKVADREWSGIQTFVLDSLASLTAILDNTDMSTEEIKEASFTAVELIGNVNAKISRLRREKIVSSIMVRSHSECDSLEIQLLNLRNV